MASVSIETHNEIQNFKNEVESLFKLKSENKKLNIIISVIEPKVKWLLENCMEMDKEKAILYYEMLFNYCEFNFFHLWGVDNDSPMAFDWRYSLSMDLSQIHSILQKRNQSNK